MLDSLDIHLSDSQTCNMLVSFCDFLGFTKGSCVSSTLSERPWDGSRSWELMSVQNHLIVISLRYSLTVKPFSHEIRSDLRDHGFFKLSLSTKDELKLLEYIGLKNQQPHYSHEKSFEKLLIKAKGLGPFARVTDHHELDQHFIIIKSIHFQQLLLLHMTTQSLSLIK